jgi:hypothetical protein
VEPEHGGLDLDERAIYDELVRIRLNTRELRIAYALRHGHDKPAELAEQLDQLRQRRAEAEDEPEQAEVLEKQYRAEARDRVQKVLDRMDRAARDSGLHEADRQLLQEVVDELAPVADGQLLADFVTRMVSKLAVTRSVRRVDPGPHVLDSEQWGDEARKGFEQLKENGIDLPEEPEVDSADASHTLDNIMKRRGTKP